MYNNVSNQFIVKQADVNAVPLIQGNFSSGYVGIGTATPSDKLNVIGNVNVTGNLTLSSTSSLLALAITTLPTCGVAYNNSIGRNASGTYGCNNTGAWVKLF
jgi:hypothetical protein